MISLLLVLNAIVAPALHATTSASEACDKRYARASSTGLAKLSAGVVGISVLRSRHTIRQLVNDAAVEAQVLNGISTLRTAALGSLSLAIAASYSRNLFYQTVSGTIAEARQGVVGPFTAKATKLLNQSVYGKQSLRSFFAHKQVGLQKSVKHELRAELGFTRLTPRMVLAATQNLDARAKLCAESGHVLQPNEWAKALVDFIAIR